MVGPKTTPIHRLPPMSRFTALLIAVALVLSACVRSSETTIEDPVTTVSDETTTSTTAPPAEDEPFYVMLMWHQHQPLYPLNDDGAVTRPWVRVHATKDYYDMAAMLKDYPDIKATFNLTPVLLQQIEALENGTRDVYWVLTDKPASQLTDEERLFVFDRFFDT